MRKVNLLDPEIRTRIFAFFVFLIAVFVLDFQLRDKNILGTLCYFVLGKLDDRRLLVFAITNLRRVRFDSLCMPVDDLLLQYYDVRKFILSRFSASRSRSLYTRG